MEQTLADSDVVIRAATMKDIDPLVALDARCFDDGQRWGCAAWAGEVEGAGLLLLACSARGDIVSAASFRLAGDTAELFSVMTDPGWRGLGLATLLLARGFDWAKRSGASEMLLEVRIGNGAQALYADLGFKPLYERTNYYGPGLHALVMRRELRGDGHE